MVARGRRRPRPVPELPGWLVPAPVLGDPAGPPAFYRGGTGTAGFRNLSAVTQPGSDPGLLSLPLLFLLLHTTIFASAWALSPRSPHWRTKSQSCCGLRGCWLQEGRLYFLWFSTDLSVGEGAVHGDRSSLASNPGGPDAPDSRELGGRVSCGVA